MREKREPWIPFKKHYGESVKSVAESDPDYLRWLLEQDWFATEKWANLYIEVEQALEDAETLPDIEEIDYDP